MFNRFLSTLSLISRFPIKGRFIEKFDVSRMDFYLPITGIVPALLGTLVLCGGYLLTASPLLTVILTLIGQYLAFNLFHLDGLMDTADAFLGTFDQEKRHAVLKDSRIGVYGFFAGFAVLSLKAGLLYTLFPYLVRFPAPLLAYPISGRFSAALIPGLTGPAKPDGLGALAKDTRPYRVIAGLFTSLVLWTAVVWGISALLSLNEPMYGPFWGLLAVPLVSPLGSVFFARMYRKHLGGYTGDALGAAVELAEILHLISSLLVLEWINVP
ncbi:MAG: adenosylcobinamide-GDP ribazoletransferase [Treponema sp.]|jgi:adenosylcobinamide-GDP ribazoletransferase|nr:adenosylcobinamide-GDP ribazoletransferase [Treponema sp.]